MTTAVSIGLYFVAAFMAAITGVIAEQYKHGREKKVTGRVALGVFAVSFLMAAVLQVAA